MPEFLSSMSRRNTLPEAEVVAWLKRGLQRGGFQGRRVREILVDADRSYLQSPFRRELEPTGTIWIGEWRPDLVCILEEQHSERLVAFEVKAYSEHEKGLVQAARYREGVHEAYLCVPKPAEDPPQWLRESALRSGIGLVLAQPNLVTLVELPARLLPDPARLLTTRQYLLGEQSLAAFGLNRPLHYAAALIACATTPDPHRALTGIWRLAPSSVPHAMRGATILGLISGEQATTRGQAYADILKYLGFRLDSSRALTGSRTRLAEAAPAFAAVLRAILIQNPVVSLIIRSLRSSAWLPITADQLAARALVIDEGIAVAAFGNRPGAGDVWRIRPTTRYQLKAALYDVGILDTRLASNASGSQGPEGYDPKTDLWQLGSLVSKGNQIVDVESL